MIYFDNAASGRFKPACVKNAVKNAIEFVFANGGRSGHAESVKAARLIEKTRSRVKEFLGLKNGTVVFSGGCTQSLNFAILGTVREEGHVLTTAIEHNSVLRPLFSLADKGKITLTVVPPDADGSIGAESILNAIRPETYLVATNHISNVTGAITPTKTIGKICRSRDILYLVDAAQSGGHGRIDMTEDCIDLCCLAPHKGIGAIQGVGVLAIGENVPIVPVLFGGTGTASGSLIQPLDLPEALESGTLPLPAIAGLCAAISYRKSHAQESADRLAALSDYALSGIKKIDGVNVYTAKNALAGIISFNIRAYHSSEVADILSEQYGICVRGGLHCAPLIHKHLGTLDTGIVRASLGSDNSFAEVDFFLQAIKEIANKQY